MKHAIQSFLTSYLLGCQNQHIENNKLFLHDRFSIEIEAFSETSFHTFSERIEDNGRPISFSELVRALVSLEDISEEKSNLFCQRVEASINNLNSLTAAKKNLISAVSNLSDLSFKATEQTLISGHYSHPYPKLLEGDLATEVVKDEMRLQWCLVHKDILHVEKSPAFKADIQRELSHLADQSLEQEDYYLFPFHPYQFEVLQFSEWMKTYIKKGLIQKIDCAEKRWIPTTSLRTLYNQDSQWMLKFSLSVRLTNSIRTLQINEVKRGMQLHEVFSLEDQLSTLTILHEPAYLSLKNENNEILKETIVVLRDNPFQTAEDKIISLATLNPIIQSLIKKISLTEKINHKEASRKWFSVFLNTAILPFVTLQARHGIYLGAHQQNLILKLDDNYYPTKAFYRDCQGTGYSQMGFEKFKDKVSTLNSPNGNILTKDFANILMGYYLFINSTLFTIKSIANGDRNLEIKLINEFNTRLQQQTLVLDKSFINYVLYSDFFYVKDNYECCLQNINENTMSDPLALYKKFKNPYLKVKHERTHA